MKITAVLFLAVVLVSVFFVETAYAQASITQTVSMSVGSIWRIGVSGDPLALVITGGMAAAPTPSARRQTLRRRTASPRT